MLALSKMYPGTIQGALVKQGLLARKALLDAAAAQDTDGASADFWLETIATLDPRNAKKKVGRLEIRFIQILSNDFAAPAIFSPCGLCNFCQVC